MSVKRTKDGRILRKPVIFILLMCLMLSVLMGACSDEGDSGYEAERNLIEVELNDQDVKAKSAIEVEKEETTIVELPTEAPTTENQVIVESTTEENITEAPTASTPVVQAVEVTVDGSHYVGEDLSSEDFTVIVTMSDGSSKKNPAGWSADRLHLSDAENEITVTYQGVATIVTVYAMERPTEAPTEVPNHSDEIEYVLNKNTKKFHYSGCKSVKQMKESNKIYFIGTREEVIGKGYKPCGNCNP